MTTTTSEGLCDLIVALLQAANVAGGNVYGVRAWPTQESQLPQVQFALPEEEKRSVSRLGAAQFTVTATLPLLISVKAPGDLDEAAAAAARAELASIERLIERTFINHPSLMQLVQQIAFVRKQGRVDGSGAEVIGQRVMMIGLEFYQGAEDFYVEDYDDLERAVVTIDTLDPYDPTGTYPEPPFPDAVKPAPRTSGPDGRAEGGLDIDLTT